MKLFHTLICCFFIVCPASAQRTISSVRDYSITFGNSRTINGVACTEPDIYLQEKEDGTFIAHRLTVKPQSAFSAFTQPYLNNATPHSIQVNWKTTVKPTDAKVVYGLSADALTGEASYTTSTVTASHHWNSAVLADLQPNTFYYYKVISDAEESEVYRFRTSPEVADKTPFRILVLGDHQRNERSDYEWLIKAAKRTLDSKYGEKPIEEHVQLLMNIGDQVDSGKVDQYEKVHLYKSRELMSNIPIMTTVGNHERFRDPDLKVYQAHYKSYGDIEYQGIKSNTAFYYAYQSGRVLFIVMNSDGTSDTQRDWVRSVVEAADKDDTVDFIISVQHRPMYAEQWCNDVCPWIKNEIMPIISQSSKHVLNLSGHHHLYARGQMTEWPVYHMITGGGVGTSATDYEQLWGATPDNRDEEAVQKTFDHYTYQIFEFDPVTKTMSCETYSLGNRRFALDNVLIDSFSRCLTTPDVPAAPEFATADAGELALPCTISLSSDVEGLHSAEYQFSRTPDFSTIAHSRVVAYEDYYGMHSNYQTRDQMEGKTIAQLALNNGDLSNGTFYVRARVRSMNLDWSDFSAPMTINVSGAAELTLDHRFYAPNQTITVHYQGAPVGTEAWVGIYVHGKSHADGDSYKWAYTTAAEGDLTFQIPTRNEYYAVLFKDGGYTEISDRVKFVVNGNCTDDNPLVLTTDKLEYLPGEPVVASFSNAPALSKDWIGIYDIATTEPINGKSHVYEYVGTKATGTITLNVPANNNYTEPLPVGEYYVSYFLCDDFTEMFPRQYFKVVEDTESAIRNIDADATDVRIYNLSGQKLNAIQKGLNIVNGKKVVYKD